MKKQTSVNHSTESQSNHEIKNDLDFIRDAYQTLPQMIAFEGQKPWNALSVFIQLSFVLAAGAIVQNFLPDSTVAIGAWVGILLSICGILATIIWISFDMRYRKITRYWVLSMRELEENISLQVVAYRRGKDFAAGDEVEVSGETIKYNYFERIPVRTGFLIIYIVFLLVFILLALYNIFRLT
jgi:hypothetical protein